MSAAISPVIPGAPHRRVDLLALYVPSSIAARCSLALAACQCAGSPGGFPGEPATRRGHCRRRSVKMLGDPSGFVGTCLAGAALASWQTHGRRHESPVCGSNRGAAASFAVRYAIEQVSVWPARTPFLLSAGQGRTWMLNASRYAGLGSGFGGGVLYRLGGVLFVLSIAAGCDDAAIDGPVDPPSGAVIPAATGCTNQSGAPPGGGLEPRQLAAAYTGSTSSGTPGFAVRGCASR